MAFTDYMGSDVANEYNYGSGGFFESAQGIFSGISDTLNTGLEGWINFEKLKGEAESYGQTQNLARESIQTPSGTTQQVPQSAGLPGNLANLTNQQLLIAGGVVLLAVYLMKG